MKKKVIIGMSGGIDSSVSAKILLEQGYDVTGCYMLLSEGASPDSADAMSAKRVAEELGIKLITADMRAEFKKNVTAYFISEYLSGRTPNPCIRCNPTTKFAGLINIMHENHADYVATGHYAQINFDSASGLYRLTASPSKKDQSYFLYRLTNEQLSRIIFPLGNFITKDDVRAKGTDIDGIIANKPDSQEICFIPGNDYTSYILSKTDITPEPGNFIDIGGNVIGTHRGIIYYTAGQRKGLGAFGKPYYVKNINAADNTVTLCTAEERFADSLTADNLIWNADIPGSGSFTAQVKIRSTAKAVPAKISLMDGKMSVSFDFPVLTPSKGQSAVVYDGATVLGGGIITG